MCAGKPPCTFLHGPGNSASGVIGCNGLDGVDVRLTQDGGLSGVPRPPLITSSGAGAPGSALLFATTATGGGFCYGSSPGICGVSCTGTDASVYGPDGEFCTDDDPQGQRGNPATLRVTTGTASGQVFNANMIAGDTICDCGVGGAGCGPSACTRPFSAVGHPFDCSALAGGSATGAALASVSVDLARSTTGDVVTTTRLVAPGGPHPVLWRL